MTEIRRGRQSEHEPIEWPAGIEPGTTARTISVGILADASPLDYWPAECRCIKVGNGYITNQCDLHNPFTGLLVEQPVQFTGLLSVLGQDDEPPTS